MAMQDFKGTITGVVATPATTGFTIAGGTTSKTLTVDETVAMSAKAPKASPVFTGPVTAADQPSFYSAVNVHQTNVTGDGTAYDVTGAFWTDVWDIPSAFVDGTFTAPTTGYYLFIVKVYLYALAADQSIVVALVTTGGTNTLLTYTGLTGYCYIPCGSVILLMTATDTAYLKVTVSGGTKSISVGLGNTVFMGELLH